MKITSKIILWVIVALVAALIILGYWTVTVPVIGSIVLVIMLMMNKRIFCRIPELHFGCVVRGKDGSFVKYFTASEANRQLLLDNWAKVPAPISNKQICIPDDPFSELLKFAGIQVFSTNIFDTFKPVQIEPTEYKPMGEVGETATIRERINFRKEENQPFLRIQFPIVAYFPNVNLQNGAKIHTDATIEVVVSNPDNIFFVQNSHFFRPLIRRAESALKSTVGKWDFNKYQEMDLSAGSPTSLTVLGGITGASRPQDGFMVNSFALGDPEMVENEEQKELNNSIRGVAIADNDLKIARLKAEAEAVKIEKPGNARAAVEKILLANYEAASPAALASFTEVEKAKALGQLKGTLIQGGNPQTMLAVPTPAPSLIKKPDDPE